ncbi:hypothetical protein [Bosea sp. RAC05]|uniref:hypothetical protein n=1 Tax=Bosea sp. RAC05 TaxID=1842539 RepID=UPI00083DA89C|nr:hypothetical protein [Bosea sp. RAC05]AOG04335.1 hypothetical protein BSY19_3996 [Bosea sp. RAC05]
MTVQTLMARLLCGLTLALAGQMAPAVAQVFDRDPRIGYITAAYAKDAVDHARRHFNLALDGSEASIANVERILAQLSASYRSTVPRPSEEELSTMAKAYGSYIGWVFITARGGEWGTGSLGEGDFSVIRGKTGRMFWPIGYVLKRIRLQSDRNLKNYYRSMIKN